MYPVILADSNLLGSISPRATVQKYIFVAVETEQNNYKKLKGIRESTGSTKENLYFSVCSATLKCGEPMGSLPPHHLGKRHGPWSDERL